jgi:hypothetical protein
MLPTVIHPPMGITAMEVTANIMAIMGAAM